MQFHNLYKNRKARKVAVSVLILIGMEISFRFIFANCAIFHIYDRITIDGRCEKLKPGISIYFDGLLEKINPSIQDVNRLGYRGKELPKTRIRPEKRIAIIGDSFTYGFGVNQNETMPFYLKKHLRHYDSKIEVINFGIPGMTLEDMVLQWKLFANQWDPDLVVFFLGQGEEDLKRSECYLQKKYQPLNGKLVYHMDDNPALKLISATALTRVLILSGIFIFYDHFEKPQPPELSKKILKENFIRLSSEQTKTGKKVLVVTLNDLLPRQKKGDVEVMLQANLNGIKYFNLGSHLKILKKTPPTISSFDSHLNSQGNKMVADEIGKWLIKTRGF